MMRVHTADIASAGNPPAKIYVSAISLKLDKVSKVATKAARQKIFCEANREPKTEVQVFEFELMLLQLSKGQLFKETFVQGDKCPRNCPRRLWSKEALTSDKLVQINFSLFSLGYYNID